MALGDMFKDKDGKVSQARVQTFGSFVIAVFLILHSYLTGKPVTPEFIYVLFGYATAQKVGNKFAESWEKKPPKK